MLILLEFLNTFQIHVLLMLYRPKWIDLLKWACSITQTWSLPCFFNKFSPVLFIVSWTSGNFRFSLSSFFCMNGISSSVAFDLFLPLVDDLVPAPVSCFTGLGLLVDPNKKPFFIPPKPLSLVFSDDTVVLLVFSAVSVFLAFAAVLTETFFLRL